MRAQLTGLLCLMAALSCSCSQGGSRSGEIWPLSALTVERLDDNVFPLAAGSFTRDENGVTACYQFVSQDCLCTSEPMLVCQGTDLLTVTANGIPLAPLGGGRYLIAGNVQEGENVLALQGNGDIGPVGLSGAFGVWPSDGGGWYVDKSRPLELGSLSSQGLPFYSGEVAYRRQYELPREVGKRILRLSGWKGRSCELWVNYGKVADITASRFKMDIGPYLTQGPNEVAIRISGWPAGEGEGKEFGLFKEFTLR